MRSIWNSVPLHREATDAADFPTGLAATVHDWHQRLDRVDIHLPPAADRSCAPSGPPSPISSSVATARPSAGRPLLPPDLDPRRLAHLLDPAALRPRSRRARLHPLVRAVSVRQRQGPLLRRQARRRSRARERQPRRIHLPGGGVLALYRRRATVEKVWPHVEKAVAYIDELRRQRRRTSYASPEKLYFGLLLESISHEGYSAHPVHSYWDDFFALKGLKDAVDLARDLGKTDEAARWAASRDEFRTDLYASLNRVIDGGGSITSPAPPIWPISIPPRPPSRSVPAASWTISRQAAAPDPGAHLRRYWQGIEKLRKSRRLEGLHSLRAAHRRHPRPHGPARARPRALGLFLADRRPPPGTSGPRWSTKTSAPRLPGRPAAHLGRLGFVRSFLDLLAYERDSDQALVLAAGVPDTWIAAPGGVTVRRLPTPSGSWTTLWRRRELDTSEGGNRRPDAAGWDRLPWDCDPKGPVGSPAEA